MPPDLARAEFVDLGCRIELFSLGGPSAALSQARRWIAARRLQLSRFEPGGELGRFNASAGRWTSVSPTLEHLLRLALHAHEQSCGLVNAAVGRLLCRAGYDRPWALGRGPVRDLRAAPLLPLPEVLELGPGRARLRSGHAIDLGGLAKGWMAEQLTQRVLGPNALANLGGDLKAQGPGPDGQGWPVALGGVTVLLRDQAAATSSVWARRWSEEGHEFNHLIDPRTGRSALGDLLEVSALAASATDAEIAAKCGLLLGSERAPAWLAAHSDGFWLLPR
ncbi:MAG TPA: FAD:protein FMN transferase [Candidatus Nitrosotalea sp.]|nr:FAD:protein FMN transferase [Candidatus Nitrosotalea sp.]